MERMGARRPSHARAAEDGSIDHRQDFGEDHELEQIRLAVRAIRYGEVRVIIQDGVVIQIERVEKQRLR